MTPLKGWGKIIVNLEFYIQKINLSKDESKIKTFSDKICWQQTFIIKYKGSSSSKRKIPGGK